jgi:hypothetical protein
LLGAETLSTEWRTLRWIVESLALIVIFAVFHRVCYEHYRFRMLVHEVVPLINSPVALSNRQLLVLLAKSSTSIANLAWTPAALLFLLYLSHLPFFGGAPLTFELPSLMFLALGILGYSYTGVRGFALKAADKVKTVYEREAADAIRLVVRLRSYADGCSPLQGDERSLGAGLQKLIVSSSTIRAARNVSLYDLKNRNFREECAKYLEKLASRNRNSIESLGALRDGLFAPLTANPIVAALIVPLGGAGGLNLVQWLVTFIR